MRFASAGLTAGALLGAFLVSGTPPLAILLFTTAWLWTVLLPGILLHRALRGRPDTLIADLAFGAVVGFAANLAVFVTLGVLGWQAYTAVWPLLVVLPVALVPKWRQIVTIAPYPARVGAGSAWILAAAAIWQFVIQGLLLFANSALPPKRTHWFPDDYYHLGIAAELTRSVPPTMPYVAGRELQYYWLPHADQAALHLASGVELPVIAERLWYPLIAVILLGLIYSVGRRFGGGAFAALLASLAVSVQPLAHGYGGTDAFALHSLTLIFSGLFILLAIDTTISALRGTDSWPDLLLFGVAMLGLAGSKVSGIPVIICGLGLAGVVALVRNRRLLVPIGWRLLLAVAAVLGTAKWFFDSSPGTPIRALSQVATLPYWWKLVGDDASGPWWLVPGAGAPGAIWMLVLLLVLAIITYAFLLPGLAILGWRRADSFFLLGIGVSGWVAMMSISHGGGSQAYFLMCAAPAWYLLAAGGAAKLWEQAAAARATAGFWGLAGAVAVVVSQSLSHWLGPNEPRGAWVGLGIFAGLAALIGWRAARLAVPDRRLAVAVAALGAGLPSAVGPLTLEGYELPMRWAAVGALAVAVAWAYWWPQRVRLLVVVAVVTLAVTAVAGTAYRVAHDRLDRPQTLSQSEVLAALWLREHTATTDLVATNVHCLHRKTTPNCSAVAYWVSGLGERRVLVEGWGYTVEAQENQGKNGWPGIRQPFDDQALFALNETAFSAPTPEILAQLRGRGVRWLFADADASPVAPELRTLARVAFETETVTIFEL